MVVFDELVRDLSKLCFEEDEEARKLSSAPASSGGSESNGSGGGEGGKRRKMIAMGVGFDRETGRRRDVVVREESSMPPPLFASQPAEAPAAVVCVDEGAVREDVVQRLVRIDRDVEGMRALLRGDLPDTSASSGGAGSVGSGGGGGGRKSDEYTRYDLITRTIFTEWIIPTPMQQKGFQKMIALSLPIIFKRSWRTEQTRILEYTQLEYSGKELGLLINAPRRFGKSVTVGVFAAAMLRYCRGISIIICANSVPAAQLLMRETQKYCVTFGNVSPAGRRAGGSDQLLRRGYNMAMGSETIEYYPASGVCNKCRITGATTNAVRGSGGDLLILEEAAFMKPEFLLQGVFPMLQMSGTVAIGISTPSERDNGKWESMLGAQNKDGTQIFAKYVVSEICGDCVMLGKEVCPHSNAVIPGHISANRREMVKQLYGSDDISRAREMGGAAVSQQVPVFNKECIDWLFDREYSSEHTISDLPRAYVPNRWYIAIDPAGGGQGSEHSWFSFCIQRDTPSQAFGRLLVRCPFSVATASFGSGSGGGG